MARPRTITDERLVAAAGQVIGRLGPALRLSDVAAEAGVAAGTLVARFGSKQGLIRAVTLAGVGQRVRRMAAVAATAATPLDGLRAALLVDVEGLDDAATVGNHVAQFGADLADDGLRVALSSEHASVHAELQRLVAACDLPGAPPPAQAARILAALAEGTQLDWALAPCGALRARLLADLDVLLSAWEER